MIARVTVILVLLTKTALLVHQGISFMTASVLMTVPKPHTCLLMQATIIVACLAKVPALPALTKAPALAAFPITFSMERSVNRPAILVITHLHALSHTKVKFKAIISLISPNATPVMLPAPFVQLPLMSAKPAILLTFYMEPPAFPHVQLALS